MNKCCQYDERCTPPGDWECHHYEDTVGEQRSGPGRPLLCSHLLFYLEGVWQAGKKVLPTILADCPRVTALAGLK